MSADSIIVNQDHWRHIAVVGSDRVQFLNGMVTQNIVTLASGQWVRALMLSHKARLLSIFDVHAFDDHLLISCAPELFDTTLETLDRHIVMDDVDLEERAMPMHCVWNGADDVWTAAPVLAARDGGASEAAIECMRIEAGMPRLGVDVTDANFPFESLLVRYVDYKKGCFTGQEPVSRVASRGGGGSKRLCGLRSEGEECLPVGAVIATEAKPEGGRISSVARSAKFGCIALGYVHKSAWEEGSEVTVDGRAATVSSLPFQGS